ncbi:MAG: cell division protein FtsH, partial [Oscillospiraceae bacterium]
ARAMVMRYGFSEKLGTVVYGGDPSEVFLGRSLSHERDYSEEVAAEIDEEVRNIIKNAYARAETTLKNHMDKLHLIAGVLIEEEKLDAADFESLMLTGKMAEKKEVIAEGTNLELKPAEEAGEEAEKEADKEAADAKLSAAEDAPTEKADKDSEE